MASSALIYLLKQIIYETEWYTMYTICKQIKWLFTNKCVRILIGSKVRQLRGKYFHSLLFRIQTKQLPRMVHQNMTGIEERETSIPFAISEIIIAPRKNCLANLD